MCKPNENIDKVFNGQFGCGGNDKVENTYYGCKNEENI